VLAALKSIEGEMDRALAEVEARTKFYSSVDDGFAQQVRLLKH